jgi:hypothetical protein
VIDRVVTSAAYVRVPAASRLRVGFVGLADLSTHGLTTVLLRAPVNRSCCVRCATSEHEEEEGFQTGGGGSLLANHSIF